ncbi:MAG: hypothetical protein ACLQGT_13785 [Terracidiphilus sp.]
MRKNILMVVFLAICPLAFAQQAQNNDSIVKLVKAGMSDDLIVSAINTQPGTYDTSADSLIALKSAGASDKVISAILQKAAASAPAVPTPTGQSTLSARLNALVVKLVQAGQPDEIILATIKMAPESFDASPDALAALKRAGASDAVVAAIVQKADAQGQDASSAAMLSTLAGQNPNDPMALHYVGIYMMTATPDGKGKMVLIKQAAAGDATLGLGGALGMAFSGGLAKAKMTLSVSGARAAIRTQEKTPVFYMYLPSNGYIYSVSTAFMTAKAAKGLPSNFGSPSQFTLISIEDKNDSREIEVGKLGLGGEKDSIDEKQTIKFNAEQIRPNVYKVTPAVDLKPGEYAFVAPTGVVTDDPWVQHHYDTAVGGLAVYDFGVD